MLTWLLLPVLAAGVGSGDANPAFAAGQVWEYHARPQDRGSLLKIQEVDDAPGGKVYHLSVVGIRFSTPGLNNVLPDVPMSEGALAASVTRLSGDSSSFPAVDYRADAEQWRKAKGGIFTMPLSVIVAAIDDPLGRE